MVCDKVVCVCERLCVTKWCVKDGVSKMVGDKDVCVKDGVSKMVCQRGCVKDGVRSGAVMGCDVISEV